MLEKVQEGRTKGSGRTRRTGRPRRRAAPEAEPAARPARIAGEVSCDIDRGVATVTLRRPASRNAITIEMIEALHSALDRIQADATVRLLVLRGEGENLSAGADVKDLLGAIEQGNPEQADNYLVREYALDLRLARLAIPLVTIADGISMGGGLGLAFGGYIVATERSRFAMPESRIGFLPDVGATRELKDRLGLPLARYFAWTSESFGGEEALRWGFADALVPSDQIEECLEALARAARGAAGARLKGSPGLAFLGKRVAGGVPAASGRWTAGNGRRHDDPVARFAEKHFAAGTRTEVLRSLRAAAESGGDPGDRERAARTLEILRQRSPISIWIADLFLALDHDGMVREAAGAKKGSAPDWLAHLRDEIAGAPAAMRDLFDPARKEPRALALALEYLAATCLFRLPDFAEGVGAFRDRRAPDFPSAREPLGVHRALFLARPGWTLLRRAARLARDPFWLDVARGELDWIHPPRAGYDESAFPRVQWFADGALNASVEAVDRWVERGRGSRIAFQWEGDRVDSEKRPLEQRAITYAELLDRVKECASALRALGLKRGDSLVLYMPNIIETYVVQLAASRIGVVYHPVFAGFAREELSDRLHMMGARVLLTADGAFRKGEVIQYKRDFVDPALSDFVPVDRAIELAAQALRTRPAGADGGALEGLREALKDKVTIEKRKLRALFARGLAERPEPDARRPGDAGRAGEAGTAARGRGAGGPVPPLDDAGRPLVQRIFEAAGRLDREETERARGASRSGTAGAAVEDPAIPEEEALGGDERALAADFASRLEGVKSAVEKVVILRRIGTRGEGAWVEGRDRSFEDFIEAGRRAGASAEPEAMGAEDALFVMFTSGSTGKPKGLVHTHGGYLARLPFLIRTLFGLTPDQSILTVADPGWITGQSFVCWGPLVYGMTSILVGFVPTEDRLWAAIERYGANFLKTGVTGIRASMGDDPEHVRSHDLGSLRHRGGGAVPAEIDATRYTSCSCAEPLDAAVQAWWEAHIGPMMNCYWRTEDSAPETGAAPSAHPQEPDASARPLPWTGMAVFVIRDEDGAPVEPRPASIGEKGTVFVRHNPGIARGTWARPGVSGGRPDPAAWRSDPRFAAIYHADVPGWHNTGDAGVANGNGTITFLGRDDEVLNVSGHRVGTQEIEGAVRSHPAVANVAAIGIPAEVRGDNPVLFVVLREGEEGSGLLDNQLRDAVSESKGSHVAPAADFIFYVPSLPTTKSGKILRRFLKYAAALDRDTLARIMEQLRDGAARSGLIAADPETLAALFPALRKQNRTLRLGSVATVDRMEVLIDVLRAVARRREIEVDAAGAAAGGADVAERAEAGYRPYAAPPEAIYTLGRTDFRAGVDPLPLAQETWGMTKGADGRPRHGEPERALVKVVEPVPGDPEPNEVVVQNLFSGSTHNVLHALMADPVSPFEWHRKPYHVLGSGAVSRVVRCGREVDRQGLFSPGDLAVNFPALYRVLDPRVSEDAMHAGFEIQGFETPDGTMRPFDRVLAPQLLPFPKGLTLEQAASFMLNLVTVYRALTHRMPVRRGQSLLIEGATGGTGAHGVEIGRILGARVIGLVSSADRGRRVLEMGAAAYLDRKDPAVRDLWTPVPDDPDEWAAWERAGEPLLEQIRARNDGKLLDAVLSFTGRPAFGRLVQTLGPGGRLSFFGAFLGYCQRFLGRGPEGGASDEAPETMFARAGLRAGMGVLVHYGAAAGDGVEDGNGLEAIRAALAMGARVVALTRTDAQGAWLNRHPEIASRISGTVSLESLRRGSRFEWPDRMPDYDRDPARYERYENLTLKPLGAAIGRLLRAAGDPRGQPDVIYARGDEDTLAADLFMVKPFTGSVVYGESRRRAYTIYAPQVWMRQRRTLFPTFAIIGSHMGNPQQGREVIDWIARGILPIRPPRVFEADEAPRAFQEMHDNASSGSFVVHLTSPGRSLTTAREIDEANGAQFFDDKYVTVRLDAIREAAGPRDGVASHIARVTMRGSGGRPPALARDAVYQIGDAFRRLGKDPRVAAVILTGEGNVAFLAGQDLRQLYDDVEDVDAALAIARDAQRIFDEVEAFPRPVIAVANGVALGGGHELLMAAHYRIGTRAPRVRLGQPEIVLNIIPGFAGTQRLTRLLVDRLGLERGVREALEMVLTGRHYEVEEALALGLLEEAVEANALERACALARGHAESLRTGAPDPLSGAHQARRRARAVWRRPVDLPADFLDGDARIDLFLEQARQPGIGREAPVVRAIEATILGLREGFEAGCGREAWSFASLVVDERYGRKGIRNFLERRKPAPLPARRSETLGERR